MTPERFGEIRVLLQGAEPGEKEIHPEHARAFRMANGWHGGNRPEDARLFAGAYSAIQDLLQYAEELRGALIWCSGSDDFGPGGVARVGWLKVVQPLLLDHTRIGGAPVQVPLFKVKKGKTKQTRAKDRARFELAELIDGILSREGRREELKDLSKLIDEILQRGEKKRAGHPK